jgi:hypothetical protein
VPGGKDVIMTANVATVGRGAHASAAAGSTTPVRLPGRNHTDAGQRSTSTPTTDSASISVAGLQYQLGEVRSQIERISASCSTCDPTRVTLLAPLYAKAQTLQSLISAANTSR